MILILTSSDDYSSLRVMDWLSHYSIPFKVINESCEIETENITVSKDFGLDWIFTINNKGINQSEKNSLADIKSYWYRRANFFQFFSLIANKSNLAHGINKYLDTEIGVLNRLVHLELDTIPHIGGYSHNITNKVFNLSLAQKCGLDIPSTVVTNSKKFIDFDISKSKKLITKPLFYGYFDVPQSNMQVKFLTKEVFEENINNYPSDFFFPTKFQELLEKKFELRVFYLNGKFFASAIFSQQDEQTKVDFRNYNYQKPNRTPPFELPEYIKNKLNRFMQLLNMNTGSIDMVVTNDNRFVFLEVNPVGQFDQVSRPCNFYIERFIAKTLINNNEN